MDNACQDPSMSQDVPFTFDIVELGALHSNQAETFRGTVRIESDTNTSHVDQISVDITKRSTSEDGMSGIYVSANMDLLLKKLTVTATFDELAGGSFGLSNCPQADIVIRVPVLSQSSAADGRTLNLNVTVDGTIGDPVFYPWVPNLVGIKGEIDLALNPDSGQIFGATILRNTVGSIAVKHYKGTHLSAVASNGTVSIDLSTVNTCRIVTHSGDIEIKGTELSRTGEIVSTELNANGMGTDLVGSDLIQQHALGYGYGDGVRGKLHASSSSGNIVIDRVSGGDIEARTGLGDIDLVLPVPGFSGPYDIRAPFGWKSLTVQRLAERLGESCVTVAGSTSNSTFSRCVVWFGVSLFQHVGADYQILCYIGFTAMEAVELDSLFSNSTLLLDKLESEDDSIFEAHRLGRIVGARGSYGNQRLLAESSSGSVHCKLREQVSNESLIHMTLDATRGSGR